MPTPQSRYDVLDQLRQRGLINKDEWQKKRGQFQYEDSHLDSTWAQYKRELGKQVSDHWAAIVLDVKQGAKEFEDSKGAKQAGFLPGLRIGMHALGMLTSFASAGGDVVANQWIDDFTRAGVDPRVTAVVATLASLGTETALTVAATAGIKKAGDIAEAFSNSSKIKAALARIIPDSAVPKAQQIMEAAKPSPASQVDIIHQPQDLPLPNKGGKMLGERKLLPAPEPDKAAIAAEEARVKAMSDTHDLLTKAQETLRPSETSEAQKTLDAAAATLRGGTTPEQILNEAAQKKAAEASDSLLLERTNEARKAGKFVGGGAPSADEEAKELNRVMKDYGDLLERYQRHGRTREMVDREVQKMLKEDGYSTADLFQDQPGDPVNEAKIMAAYYVTKPYLKEAMDLMKSDAAMVPNSPEFWQALTRAKVAAQLNPVLFGKRSTAGQTLAIFNDPTKVTTKFLEQSGDVASWMAGEDLNTAADVLREQRRIVEHFRGLKSEDEFMQVQANKPDDLGKAPGWKDYVFSYLAPNALAPVVIGKKLIYDSAATLWKPLIQMPMRRLLYSAGQGLEGAINMSTGYNISLLPKGIKLNDIPVEGETLARMFGMRNGLMAAWNYMREANFTGLGEATQSEMKPGILTQALERRWGSVGYGIGAAHEIVPYSIKVLTNAIRMANFESEVQGQLFRRGTNLGYTGEELLTWIAKERKNVTKEVMDAGLEAADAGTGTDALGQFGNWVQRGRMMFPALRAETLFWKVPTNVFKFGWQRGPTAVLSPKNWMDLTSGNVSAIDAAAKMMLGTISGGALSLYAMGGNLQGGGPSDPVLRKSMMDLGSLHPYSFRNPWTGNWVSYEIHPFKNIIGPAADLGNIFGEIANAPDLEHPWIDAAYAFTTSSYRALVEMPAFLGIRDMGNSLDALQRGDLAGAANRTAGHFASLLVPYSTTMRAVANDLDPTVRETKTAVDYLYASVPGLKNILAPERNMFGKPVQMPAVVPDIPGARVLSIFKTYDNPDALSKELGRLQVGHRAFPDHIDGPVETNDLQGQFIKHPGVPLNADEKDFRDQRAGELYHEMSQDYFSQPDYGEIPEPERRNKFQTDFWMKAMRQANDEATDKFPSLAQRRDVARAAGKTAAPFNAQVDQGARDFLDLGAQQQPQQPDRTDAILNQTEFPMGGSEP